MNYFLNISSVSLILLSQIQKEAGCLYALDHYVTVASTLFCNVIVLCVDLFYVVLRVPLTVMLHVLILRSCRVLLCVVNTGFLLILENGPFYVKSGNTWNREFSIIFIQVRENKLFSQHIIFINDWHGCLQSRCS